MNAVPQEIRRTVNPQRGKYSSLRTNNQGNPQLGKTRRNPREGISGDRKSQRRSKLVTNRINSEVPAEQFQRRSELAPKGINSEAPAKTKRNTEKEYPGIFIPKGDTSWHLRIYFLLAPARISLGNENPWRFLLGGSSLLSMELRN